MASIFYMIAIMALVTLAALFLTVFPICFLLPYSPNPEEIEGFLPFCHFLSAGLAILFAVSLIEYRKGSRVRVCCEGLLIGGRMIKWEDIEDVKILHKTYADAGVERVPVVGYGIRDGKLHSSTRGTCLHGLMLKDNISRLQPWVIKFKRPGQKILVGCVLFRCLVAIFVRSLSFYF